MQSLGRIDEEGLPEQPGEVRAIAGGVGPLSFAGSGYGLMLIFMVSRAVLETRRALR
jgi:hypothetical protein